MAIVIVGRPLQCTSGYAGFIFLILSLACFMTGETREQRGLDQKYS